MNKYIKFVLSPLIKRIQIEEEKIICEIKSEIRISTEALQREFQNVQYSINQVPLYSGEKIRILFLFQVASFWPSMEPLYEELSKDCRFHTKLLCYDENYDKTIKTETARQFLKEKEIPYFTYEEFNIDSFRPHIVFVQTPYDSNRTQRFKTGFLKSKGYRIIYIPYGIEISATEHAKRDHFNRDVVLNCWKLYTLSDVMKKDYFKYCGNASAVCALGLPRFDALYHSEKYPLANKIKKKASGRKIVLWKVHFPKVISEKGKNKLVTPYIEEYIAFAKTLKNYKDLFFIFMPHPRFYEFNDDVNVRKNIKILIQILKKTENVYIDTNDDYRNSLIHSQSVIVDRSGVMVEAGSLGVPVLYMYNPDYKEPLSDAIQPLVNTYYQGKNYKDMELFLHMCQKGEDPLKSKRSYAFKRCVPYFDGKCSSRIIENIIQSLAYENNIKK